MTDQEKLIHSAQFLLEEIYSEDGMEKMAALTGYPMGVVVACFENIFAVPREIRSRDGSIVEEFQKKRKG